MAPEETLALIADEDRAVVDAVAAEDRRVARGARFVASTLASGGRVLFLGTGTSGRLGVLEAAECPPTFGTDPQEIVALVAGGPNAVFRSREGAEDDAGAARRTVRAERVGRRDLLVGISASSVTPYVREGLAAGRARGAKSILVACGSRARGIADVVIAPQVGPEILAGSTRLKAGTATKLVLNRLTLLAMIRLGKLYGPFMVDLRLGSEKLLDRAVRMVSAIAGVSRRRARELLAACEGSVARAVVAGSGSVTAAEAKRLLEKHGHRLRDVLEEEFATTVSRKQRVKRKGAHVTVVAMHVLRLLWHGYLTVIRSAR